MIPSLQWNSWEWIENGKPTASARDSDTSPRPHYISDYHLLSQVGVNLSLEPLSLSNLSLRNATATIHIFSLTLSTKEQELVQEKQKMDDLLFLTLPLQVLKDSSWSKKAKQKQTFCSFADSEGHPIQKKDQSHQHWKRVDPIQVNKNRKCIIFSIFQCFCHSDLMDFTELYSDSTPCEVNKDILRKTSRKTRFKR